MDKINVGLFIDTWYPMVDGVIMVVDNYAKRLAKFCNVTVFTVKPTKKIEKEYLYKVVQCKTSKIAGLDYDLPWPDFDEKFKKEIKKSNLDIVHIHSPFFVGSMGVKYAKKHKIPVVATMHSQFEKDFQRAVNFKPIVKGLLKNVMKVFNKCDEYYGVNAKISQIFKEYGAKHLPLVQRNGTDLEPIQDEDAAIKLVNKKFNLKEDEIVFLFVGRINKLKNVFFIVDALSKLKNKNFKMLFVGEGQDMQQLKKHVEELSLKNNVIFTGKIMDRELIKAIYLRAKLFLFPSKYDASSLVQIEAASQKTPTIFLKDSATSATVTDNINGFLSEDSVDAFANKITEVIENESLYNKVSQGCFRDLYVSWDDCVKEMYQKYLEQIEKKKQYLKQIKENKKSRK
ncbi:MAG: glycosyltransferase [Clostridia bacterium]|nr:glycosyltransferase [Clostridia bacterium]